MAPPRMQLYLYYSARVYSIYLKYISKDDIHVYSVSLSLTQGQVLMSDYSIEKGLIIAKEMMDVLCLDMVDKGLVSKSFNS
jgi:DNA polymerase V